MTEYPIGHVVKSSKFARRGGMSGTRKVDGPVETVA